MLKTLKMKTVIFKKSKFLKFRIFEIFNIWSLIFQDF
jgi:hypothetical protein